MKVEHETEGVVTLPSSITEHIELWLKKFPPEQRRSAVIEALHVAQEHYGWLSTAVMDAVASYLRVSPISVYEVASFYDMFDTAPRGRHLIGFCTGVACMLRGVDEVLEHCAQRLGVAVGETTADGMITLRELQCLGACDGAPMCQIDHRHYHINLDKTQADDLLDQLQNDKEPFPKELKSAEWKSANNGTGQGEGGVDE
jgi:NADH-quinone oxidoreductase subunit E